MMPKTQFEMGKSRAHGTQKEKNDAKSACSDGEKSRARCLKGKNRILSAVLETFLGKTLKNRSQNRKILYKFR